VNALWRRLDRRGHDAAWLRPKADGWRLSGAAVFRHEEGPAALAYAVEVDGNWAARRAIVQGFVGAREVDCEILRTFEGWRLNGVLVEGLNHLIDLDLSFTPATNALALKRAAPAIGETASLPAAWFDIDAARLAELPQTYERLGATAYRYVALSVPYEAVLEFTGDGFVHHYPGLWRREE
jgi:hypothetical protein